MNFTALLNPQLPGCRPSSAGSLLVENAEFDARLAVIRTRFAAKLGRRIEDAAAALPRLCGKGRAVLQYVEAAHRAMHELCGVGPTLGFIETGRAARYIERMLLTACRERRGLSTVEVATLEAGLENLRAAARADSAAAGLALE